MKKNESDALKSVQARVRNNISPFRAMSYRTNSDRIDGMGYASALLIDKRLNAFVAPPITRDEFSAFALRLYETARMGRS
jgi:hypothetical protein